MAKKPSAVPNYSAMMAQAQDAVLGIADPDLKRIAFERLLDKLLGNPNSVSQKVNSVAAQPESKGSRDGKGKYQGPKGRVEQLIEEDFFKTPKSIADIRTELAHRGFHIPVTTLSGPLQRLCQNRRLRRRKEKVGNKEGYVYSNW